MVAAERGGGGGCFGCDIHSRTLSGGIEANIYDMPSEDEADPPLLLPLPPSSFNFLSHGMCWS